MSLPEKQREWTFKFETANLAFADFSTRDFKNSIDHWAEEIGEWTIKFDTDDDFDKD
jgi:hypothetical protein